MMVSDTGDPLHPVLEHNKFIRFQFNNSSVQFVQARTKDAATEETITQFCFSSVKDIPTIFLYLLLNFAREIKSFAFKRAFPYIVDNVSHIIQSSEWCLNIYRILYYHHCILYLSTYCCCYTIYNLFYPKTSKSRTPHVPSLR